MKRTAPSARAPAMRLAAVLLLLLGLALWAWVKRGNAGQPRQLLAVAAALLLATPVAFAPRLRRSLARVNRGSFRQRLLLALLVTVVCGSYLTFTAFEQHRDRFPKIHDEFVYLLQAHELAAGRLWMPHHPLEDFFDSEYVLVHPVYTAAYFPGAAMSYAPGVWLGVPAWATSLLLCAVLAGLLFLVVAELASVQAGLLAALLLIAIEQIRDASFSVNSHILALLLATTVLLAWLRWEKGRRLGWAALLGLCAGWLMLTRPVDGLCYLIPVALAATLVRWSPRRATAAMLAIACAMPLVAIQLTFDMGVTGKPLSTPYSLYMHRDSPQVTLGFPRFNPSLHAASHVLQKQLFYQRVLVPIVIAHQWPAALHDWIDHRLPLWLETSAPAPLLLVLLPIGLLGLSDRRRWAMWAAAPLFLIAYGIHTPSLPEYSLAMTPAIVLTIVLALDVMRRTWPGKLTSIFIPAAVAGLAIAQLPEITRVPDGHGPAPMAAADHDLPNYIHEPAVVLFLFHPWNDVHDEPVYNADVAWPDDAPIIHAHDLGLPRDEEIFRYYAQHQPWRVFYQFDEGNRTLRRLGTAAQLARQYISSKSD